VKSRLRKSARVRKGIRCSWRTGGWTENREAGGEEGGMREEGEREKGEREEEGASEWCVERGEGRECE